MTIFNLNIQPVADAKFLDKKREFARLYNGGQDIHGNDRKMIDFHEHLIKQMFVFINNAETQFQTTTQKINALEQRVTIAEKKADEALDEARLTKHIQHRQEKLKRLEELKTELCELENDLKFYSSDN